jgi:hypothetical protein
VPGHDEANLVALVNRLRETRERATRDAEDVLDALLLENIEERVRGRYFNDLIDLSPPMSS